MSLSTLSMARNDLVYFGSYQLETGKEETRYACYNYGAPPVHNNFESYRCRSLLVRRLFGGTPFR
jgi:hypothetical protein